MQPEKRLTVGIWLEVPLGAKLVGEGIYQLTMNLVRHSIESAGTRWVFAAPPWVTESLRDLLDDQRIPPDAYDILSEDRPTPLLIRLRDRLNRPKGETRKRRWSLNQILNLKVVRTVGLRVLGPILSLANPAALLTLAALVLALGVYCATTLPIAAIAANAALGAAVLFGIVVSAQIARFVLRFAMSAARSAPAEPGSYDKDRDETKKSLKQKFIDRLGGVIRRQYARASAVARGAMRVVSIHEYVRLAQMASRRTDVDVWYVPHPGYYFANLIKRPKVVAAPDLVFVDFPTSFVGQGIVEATDKIRKVVAQADLIVSYSDYVRREHVVRHLGREASATRVIPHAPIVLDDRLQSPDGTPEGLRGEARRVASRFVREHLSASVWTDTIPKSYLADFPFDETPFLFVSSQIRHHKNCTNLISAFETILRRRHRNVKMIITGNLGRDDTGLKKQILERQLELDVLSIPRMPNDVHAAFYALAALTVVPTLFEGGFPFPFSESLSVGTPVVMSSIPVTQETVPPDLAKIMLFEPYDPNSIAETILWALDHREELLARQRLLFRELKDRTWSDVASEYLEAFRQAAWKSGSTAIHASAQRAA